MTGFREGSDRSNLCFRTIILAVVQRMAWSSGLQPQMCWTEKFERDPNLGLRAPSPSHPVQLVWREAKEKRGPVGDPAVIQPGDESTLDRNGRKQRGSGMSRR